MTVMPQFQFNISRAVDAPRALVWKAWTDPESLKHWWSPKGFKNTFNKVDLRPGGMFHYGLETPQGQKFCGRFIYREVVPPEHGQAETVEGRDEGQQHRVGVRRHDADRHVCRDDQGREPAAVAHQVGGHRALDAEADRGVRPDADREREDEQEQLRAPATPVHEAHEGSGLTHRRRRQPASTSWRAA